MRKTAGGHAARRVWLALLSALPAAIGCQPASAHERSESVSHWNDFRGTLEGVVTVRTREVTRLLLPGESDAAIGEVFAAHVANSLSASVDGVVCTALRPPQALMAEPGFLRVGIAFRCPAGKSLTVGSDLFFDVSPTHHHFIYVQSDGGASREGILDGSMRQIEVDLQPLKPAATRFLQFIGMGIEHIATGVDHLTFLFALLLTARAARQVLIIVTGFTLGHSLTLTLAATGMIHANRGAVEALIGLTIALAAAANLLKGEREGGAAAAVAAVMIGAVLLFPADHRPQMPAALVMSIALAAASVLWLASSASEAGAVRGRFLMATGFGLIHGLGFASALLDLELPPHLLASTLLGFNIGVEIGQLMLVMLACALLRALGRARWMPVTWDAVRGMSSATLIAVGTAWFLTRSVAIAQF